MSRYSRDSPGGDSPAREISVGGKCAEQTGELRIKGVSNLGRNNLEKKWIFLLFLQVFRYRLYFYIY